MYEIPRDIKLLFFRTNLIWERPDPCMSYFFSSFVDLHGFEAMFLLRLFSKET